MAKKIRFPLEMENGVEVRSMEELREHFSLAKVLEYFENGKLVTWLRDRYADDIADAVEALEQNELELARKLSEIFDVPYDENTEEALKKAEERAERLKRLKEFTDDEHFFDKIDYVAFEQDELYDLLDEETETIYLCGDRFSIPVSKSGVSYIGINNPNVIIDTKKYVDLEEKGIILEKVKIDEAFQKLENIEIDKVLEYLEFAEVWEKRHPQESIAELGEEEHYRRIHEAYDDYENFMKNYSKSYPEDTLELEERYRMFFEYASI